MAVHKNRYTSYFFTLLLLLLIPFHAISAKETNYSIVFIHIGDKIPDYAEVAMKQARLFNKDSPIIMLANRIAIKNKSLLKHMKDDNITFIACESLTQTSAHKKFKKFSKHNIKFRNGFWRYTSERFLYLNDLMSQYNLKNIFHLEYDNMLYADLSTLLPTFEENYKGIAATFHNEQECIPGLVYIATKEAMKELADYFATPENASKNDMVIIGSFKNQNPEQLIDSLPIVHKEYLLTEPPHGNNNANITNKELYSNHIDKFDVIFDAAAIGQYLGGIDPRNGASKPGFIRRESIFNPSKMEFQWIANNEGLLIPYAIFLGVKKQIINLHIHSKKLRNFSSK